jgi:hypothetical protein
VTPPGMHGWGVIKVTSTPVQPLHFPDWYRFQPRNAEMLLVPALLVAD